jgi:uncharacterized repeat protein (TIGR01451 family)
VNSYNGTAWTLKVLPGSTTSCQFDGSVQEFALSAVDRVGNESSKTIHSITADPASDLSVDQSHSPDDIRTGENLAFTIHVSNAGPDTATNVVLSDTLPLNMNYISSQSTAGTCSVSNRVMTCNLGSITKNTQITATLVVMPTIPGDNENVAEAFGAEEDLQLNDNSATDELSVGGLASSEDDTLDNSSEQPPGSPDGWSQEGLTNGDPELTLGSFDETCGAYRTRVFSAPGRFRLAGWFNNRQDWLPYDQIGSSNYVRAKFYMYAQPPSGSFADIREYPNFNLRLATRFAVTTTLQVNSHDHTDPANLSWQQELRPSTDPANPSVYRLDFDPIDVPYLNSATGEGILSGFEVYSLDSTDDAYLGLTELAIGCYPASQLDSSNALQTKIYAVSDTDAGNLKIFNSATDFRECNYALPPEGSPNGTPLVTDMETPLGNETESPAGVTLDTLAVPADRIGFIERSFYAGDPDGSPGYTNRIRIAENQQYKIRWHVTSTRATSDQAWLWLSQRSVKFGYTQFLQLAGGHGSNGAANLALIHQSVPGVGCENPDKDGSENGGWYTVLMNTPMSRDIRPEFAPGVALSVRMPQITGLPGPGENSASNRDVKLAASIYDSTSAGTGAANEAGLFTIDRIEVSSFPQVQD